MEMEHGKEAKEILEITQYARVRRPDADLSVPTAAARIPRSKFTDGAPHLTQSAGTGVRAYLLFLQPATE